MCPENFKLCIFNAKTRFSVPTITSADSAQYKHYVIIKHPKDTAARMNQYSQWSINTIAGLHGLIKNRLWLTLCCRYILDWAQRVVHKWLFQCILGLSRRKHSSSRCRVCVGWKDWRDSSDICYLNRWESAVLKSTWTQRSAIKLDKNTQSNTRFRLHT